jgi:CDP-glucose 4,6-dehydratase
MVTSILRLMGRSDLKPVILDRAEAEIEIQYLDASKAHHRLGWRPQYAMDEALTETIAWYRKFFSAMESLRV